MTTNFELGKIPGGVLVSGTLDVSERGFVCCKIAVDIEGYFNFALPSALRSSGLNKICTYTSRTRVSDANPRERRSSHMVGHSASWILKRDKKTREALHANRRTIDRIQRDLRTEYPLSLGR